MYRDFPEVYHAFSAVPKTPETFEVLQRHFDFTGKRVLDVGSGTGSSTRRAAELAAEVIGAAVRGRAG